MSFLSNHRTVFILAAAGLVVVLLNVPAIPISNSLKFEQNYMPGYSVCFPSMNGTSFRSCLARFEYPPANLTAEASFSRHLLGVGIAPYPALTLVQQGAESALVHFRGEKIAYAEGPFEGPVVFNPTGVIFVENPSVQLGPNGVIDFSALIRNVGQVGITIVGAYFDYPGYGINRTVGGVVWHSGSGPVCSDYYLAPEASCSAALYANENSQLRLGASYPYSWVVVGQDPRLPDAASSPPGVIQIKPLTMIEGGNFIYSSATSAQYPGSVLQPIDGTWVHSFIDIVNSNRGPATATEKASLDSFAQLRFQTAVSNYQISDFGFDSQSKVYANGTALIMNEEILYPIAMSPSDFAAYLQTAAPGHWSLLTNGAYTLYGFYLGYGPAIAVGQDCRLTEITQRNVNITQLVVQAGCQYQVKDVTYLLIVLSS